MRKFISVICLLLCSACIFCSCSKNAADKDTTAAETTEAYETFYQNISNKSAYGDTSSAYHFITEITDADGNQFANTIYIDSIDTDLITALSTKGLVTLDGTKLTIANHDLKPEYSWKVYVNGALYSGDLNEIKLEQDAVYSFVAYKI